MTTNFTHPFSLIVIFLVGASSEWKGFKCLNQPSSMRRKIDSELKLNPNLKKMLLEGLSEALTDENWLYYALLPMYVEIDDSSFSGLDKHGGGFFMQESFINVLLGIDSLQPDVISAVLEQLPDLTAFSEDEMREGNGLLNSSRRAVSLPHLVLQQLRWMDHVVDPSALTDKLLDCAMVLNIDLQRDLITYLSDIVQDTETRRVVEALEGLLALEESLLASILDAYTSMNLPMDVLRHIARSMLERLPSIEPTVLPVLVRFLLETSGSCRDPDFIRDFLLMLRKIMSLPEEPPAGEDSSAASCHLDSSFGKGGGLISMNQDDSGTDATLTLLPEGDAEGRSYYSLTLEELFQGLKIRPCVATAFFKILDEIKYPCDYRPIDVWALFCLHDTQQYSRKVLTVIRKKVTAGHFTYKLLSDALCCRIGVLGPFFSSLLILADTLVRIGGGKAIRMWGVYLYSLLFTSFPDLYHRQETLGGVLAHAGSGLQPEVQSALEVLESIPPSALKPFATLVKGLLEFMQGFSDVQVRCIFQILCNLISGGDTPGSMDDMHIYIRKNLSLRDMTFKRFGIIGAVSYVLHISRCSNSNAGKSTCEGNRDAISMLALIRMHTKNQPEAAAFAYDELCRLILAPNVSAEVTQWVAQESSAQLEQAFLVELDDDEVCPPSDSLKNTAFDGAVRLRLTHGLNGQDNGIAFNIMQVLSSRENRTRMKATYLIPVLGLALVSSLASEGSLANVDAIIGAPLVLPDQDTINSICTMEAPVQEAICWAYYYALDWCREVINGFMGDNTTTLTVITDKVVLRFDTLMELEKILVFLLKRNPNFVQNHMGGLLSGSGIDKKERKAAAVIEKKKGKNKRRKLSSLPVESEELIRNYLHVTMRPLGHRVPFILASSQFRSAMISRQQHNESSKFLILRLLLGELHRHISCALTSISTTSSSSMLGMVSTLNSRRLIHSVSQPPSSPLPQKLQLLQLYLDRHVFSAIGQYFKDIKMCLDGGEELGRNIRDDSENHQHALFSLYIILKIIKLLISSEELRDGSPASIVMRAAIGAIAYGDGVKNGDSFGHLLDELFSTVMLVSSSLSLSVEICEAIDMTLTVRAADTKQQNADSPQLPPLDFEYHQRLGKICLSLLGNDWLHSEDVDELTTKRGSCNAGTFQVLASLYLNSMCSTPLDCDLSDDDHFYSPGGGIDVSRGFGGLAPLVNYCNTVLGAGVDGTLNGYPSLTKTTFVFFYKPAMIALIKVLKDLELGPKVAFHVNGNTDSQNNTTYDDAQSFVLHHLKRIVDVFTNLIGFTRVYHRRQVLAIALTEGRRLMTELLKHMSILEDTFSKHQEMVLKILNSVQPATRQMHILLLHAKRSGDKSMVWEAPKCRKILEKFIFRVKKILQANNCIEAMLVGNLEARNLDGTLGNPDESPSESDESENDQEDAQYGGCSADENSDTDGSDHHLDVDGNR